MWLPYEKSDIRRANLIRKGTEASYSGDNMAMSEEQPTETIASEVTPAAPAEPVRNEPPPPDPRRRLRELLAIPDHQRTDAIWDEIIELEISLAPGNRIQPGSNGQGDPGRRPQGPGQNQGRRPDQQQPRRQDGTPGNKPSKRFFKKPKRPPGAQPKT
jgi:hypothetical protein